MLEGIQGKLSAALTSILPESGLSDYIIANAFFIITVLLVLFIFFFLFAAFFLDFITDVWKLPFAVGVDVLVYLGLGTPVLSLVAAVLAVLIFLFLADSAFWKWVFGLAATVAALIPYFSIAPWAVIIAVLPITTVLMFIDTIVD